MAVRIDFNQLNRDVRLLIAAGVVRPNIGIAIPLKAVTIRSANRHLSKHGVAIETAQGYVVVAWRMINKSILQDYEFPVDASMVTKERAKKYCEHCGFDQISGPPTRVGMTEVSQVV